MRMPAMESATPPTIPTTRIARPSRNTRSMIDRVVAPTAIRTANSRVRPATVNAITLYRPTAPSSNAANAAAASSVVAMRARAIAAATMASRVVTSVTGNRGSMDATIRRNSGTSDASGALVRTTYRALGLYGMRGFSGDDGGRSSTNGKYSERMGPSAILLLYTSPTRPTTRYDG